MKGASEIVGHTVFIFIGVIAMSLIISGLSGYLSDIEKRLNELEINYAADTIASSIMSAYSISAGSESFEGNFSIPFSEKIGTKNVLLELEGDNLTVSQTSRNQKIEAKRKIVVNASLSGSAYLPAYIKIIKTGVGTEVRLLE